MKPDTAEYWTIDYEGLEIIDKMKIGDKIGKEIITQKWLNFIKKADSLVIERLKTRDRFMVTGKFYGEVITLELGRPRKFIESYDIRVIHALLTMPLVIFNDLRDVNKSQI